MNTAANTRNTDDTTRYYAIEEAGVPQPVDVDIVIPAYNEAEELAASVTTLMAYLEGGAPPVPGAPRHNPDAWTWNVVIAENGSTDDTWQIAQDLSALYPGRVRALRMGCKGRGYALKTTWLASEARVVAYMDVDLSTGIEYTDALVTPLLSGKADVAIGSRLAKGAQVERSLKREFISRTYNRMLAAWLHASFTDAQCGFKAMTREAARQILPLVEDDGWFFDTEMLALAQEKGYALSEVPVRWVEDAGTTVDIADTARKDIAGMRRVRRQRRARRRATRAQADETREDGWHGTLVARPAGAR